MIFTVNTPAYFDYNEILKYPDVQAIFQKYNTSRHQYLGMERLTLDRITQAYQEVFNRKPTKQEYLSGVELAWGKYLLADKNGGVFIGRLKTELFKTEEYLTLKIVGIRETVRQAFIRILEREPAEDELTNDLIEGLLLGKYSTQDIDKLLTESEEKATLERNKLILKYSQFITERYETILKRQPTVDELKDWVAKMLDGMSESEATYWFQNSKERVNLVTNAVPKMTTQQATAFVTAVLQESLKRTPDSATINSYVQRLVSSSATSEQIKQEIEQSEEAVAIRGISAPTKQTAGFTTASIPQTTQSGETMADLGAVISSGTAVLNTLGQLGSGQPITIGGVTVQQTSRTGAETLPPADRSEVAVTQAKAINKSNTMKYGIIAVVVISVVMLYFIVNKK